MINSARAIAAFTAKRACRAFGFTRRRLLPCASPYSFRKPANPEAIPAIPPNICLKIGSACWSGARFSSRAVSLYSLTKSPLLVSSTPICSRTCLHTVSRTVRAAVIAPSGSLTTRSKDLSHASCTASQLTRESTDFRPRNRVANSNTNLRSFSTSSLGGAPYFIGPWYLVNLRSSSTCWSREKVSKQSSNITLREGALPHGYSPIFSENCPNHSYISGPENPVAPA